MALYLEFKDTAFLSNLIQSYKQGSDEQPTTSDKHSINTVSVLPSNQYNVAAVTNKSTNNPNICCRIPFDDTTENLAMMNHFANFPESNNKHTGQAATRVENHGPNVNNISGNSEKNTEDTHILLAPRRHQKWININNSIVFDNPEQYLYTLMDWHTIVITAIEVKAILHISCLNQSGELAKDM